MIVAVGAPATVGELGRGDLGPVAAHLRGSITRVRGCFPSVKNPDWPTDPGILRRRVRQRWDATDLQPLGFHEGRHTFASIGITASLNAKTLSTYLSHATITLDRYGHLMPGSEVEARAMLDAYLRRP